MKLGSDKNRKTHHQALSLIGGFGKHQSTNALSRVHSMSYATRGFSLYYAVDVRR
jgi:hypothetical protein